MLYALFWQKHLKVSKIKLLKQSYYIQEYTIKLHFYHKNPYTLCLLLHHISVFILIKNILSYCISYCSLPSIYLNKTDTHKNILYWP